MYSKNNYLFQLVGQFATENFFRESEEGGGGGGEITLLWLM